MKGAGPQVPRVAFPRVIYDLNLIKETVNVMNLRY